MIVQAGAESRQWHDSTGQGADGARLGWADRGGGWISNDNASHGFLIAPVAAFLAWQRRRQFRAQPAAIYRPALAAVAGALGLYLLARYAEIEFLSAVSFLVLVGGLLWYLFGPARMRVWAFPYLFLWFMIPWPDLLVEFLSFPLQLWAARAAAAVIRLLGMSIMREGVDLHIAGYSFAVAAPCSGMRSLVALMALAALLAYLCRGPLWRRLTLFALGLPMALVANAVRVVVVLLVGARFGPESAESFLHTTSGLVVFLVAVGGLYGLARLLRLRPLGAH